MAAIDYLLCAKCGCETIYDANIDYEDCDAADILVLCKKCKEHYSLELFDKQANRRIKPKSRGSDFLG